jgi:hypothetical protein
MAWTTPPTFSDNAVLSAAQLNILSDDLAYLYGLLQAPQPAITTFFSNQNLTSSNNKYVFRYKHRYLHYRVTVADDGYGDNTNTLLELWVNGTRLLQDTNTRPTGYVYSGYVDLNSLGLTLGTVYPAYWVSTLGTLSELLIEYLIQAEGTSL